VTPQLTLERRHTAAVVAIEAALGSELSVSHAHFEAHIRVRLAPRAKRA